MKKNLIALALVAGSAFVGVANAVDGTITMTGNITDATCAVTVPDMTIDFKGVGSTSFGAVGTGSGDKPFNIALTGCPTGDSISIRFNGAADATKNDLIGVTGGATGVAVGFFESNGTTAIARGTDSAAHTVPATGDLSLQYVAKYVKTQNAIVEGTANANADFVIVYN